MAKTVKELIGELLEIKDKNKPLYSHELEEDNLPMEVELTERDDCVLIDIYEG